MEYEGLIEQAEVEGMDGTKARGKWMSLEYEISGTKKKKFKRMIFKLTIQQSQKKSILS